MVGQNEAKPAKMILTIRVESLNRSEVRWASEKECHFFDAI